MEPEIVEKETICPEEKLLRSIFGLREKPFTEPIDEMQDRCVCGKYRGKKYGNFWCDRCRQIVKERSVRRLPDGWRFGKEYKKWLKNKRGGEGAILRRAQDR